MLFYSHWLDLLGKLISLAAIVTFLIAAGVLQIVDALANQTPNPTFFVWLGLTLFVIGFYFAVHRPIMDVMITMLYVRISFGVAVSWEQAKVLRRLFCLNLRTLQWSPMRHVRTMPAEQRLHVLMEAAHG